MARGRAGSTGQGTGDDVRQSGSEEARGRHHSSCAPLAGMRAVPGRRVWPWRSPVLPTSHGSTSLPPSPPEDRAALVPVGAGCSEGFRGQSSCSQPHQITIFILWPRAQRLGCLVAPLMPGET